VTTVADKLAATLSEGGYLMTGHTELIGYAMTNMRSRLFAEGVVYQRIAAPPAAMAPATVPTVLSPSSTGPTVVRSLAATPPLPDVSHVSPSAARGADDLLAAARQLADCGEYARAEQACRQALAVAPLAAEAHFLLAQLAQLNRDFDLAGQLLEKTLYLDPGNVAAHLELAALCERADNLPRAQTLRHAALDIVRNLPADAAIEPYEATAAELAQWLAQ
jgi:chemotaxis protein methyltransferase CheR